MREGLLGSGLDKRPFGESGAVRRLSTGFLDTSLGFLYTLFMAYRDPAVQRDYLRRWRTKNKKKVNAYFKKWWNRRKMRSSESHPLTT